jgi:gliding motility-associated-like protein
MKKIFSFIISAFYTVCFGQFTVDFSANMTDACVQSPVSFMDLSTSSSTIDSWVWDFGDGNSSTQQNPSHSYTSAGIYTVILTAFSSNLAISEVKQNYIQVLPLPQPSFHFSGSTCSIPANISFTNVQPNNNAIYSWEFGNGQTSQLQNPTNILYNTEGIFQITLSVQDISSGCENTISQNIQTNNFQSSFTIASSTICTGTDVSFLNTSSFGANIFSWNFGNGTTSSQENPTASFQSAGEYQITLNAQNSAVGCSSSSTQTITVIETQLPSLVPSIVEGCNPSTVVFENTSGFQGAFEWDFGNGQSFYGDSPNSIMYEIPLEINGQNIMNQQFSVSITSTDPNGCNATQHYPNLISIFNIIPNFIAAPNQGCEPLEVELGQGITSGSSNYPITHWFWDFGNGNTSTEPNPVATYMHGIYQVSVTVSTDLGCEQSFENTVSAGTPPFANINILSDTICANTLPVLEITSGITSGSLLDSIGYQFSYENESGIQVCGSSLLAVTLLGNVDLIVAINYLGCNTVYTIENAFYVQPALAKFTTDDIICNVMLPHEVEVNNLANLGTLNDSVQLIFDFGDGSILVFDGDDAFSATGQTITHSYNDYGSYIIKQIAHNFTTGCSDFMTMEINLMNFSFDILPEMDTICQNSELNFLVNYSAVPNFSLFNYFFNIEGNDLYEGFSDTQLTGSNFSHNFENSGPQTITLFGTNEHGCINSSSTTIFVRPSPQVVLNQSENVGCEPLEVFFDSESLTTNGYQITHFSWTHDGISVMDSGNQSSKTFLGSGQHQTILTITDSWGCIGHVEASTTITKPSALFLFPSTICNNTSENIINMSSDFSNATWFLDNDYLSNTLTPTINFSHADTIGNNCFPHLLKLVLVDQNGCTDSALHQFNVSAPTANFEYSFLGANMNEFGDFTCPSVFANLTNQSSSCGSITSYAWNFGDGKTSSLQNPSNTYVYPGSYTASLKITDSFGCEDVFELPNYLTIGGPQGSFQWLSIGGVCGREFEFSPLEIQNGVQVIWDMGNNEILEGIDGISYFYTETGNYFPTATLLDANGCAITYYLDTIEIIPNSLNASFLVNPTEISFGESVTISNQSSGGFGGITSNDWSIENQFFTENANTFSYEFQNFGSLLITLIVTDSLGCMDSAWLQVQVIPTLEIPNVFSPNNDGINDIFRLIKNPFKSYEVIIMNRWGNELAKTEVTDDDYLWDGLLGNNQIALEGVYFYAIKGFQIDGVFREEQGFFHLIKD